MGIKKTVVVFLGLDLVFLGCGGMMIALTLISKRLRNAPPQINSVAADLALGECPLTALLINGALMLLTFAVSIPAIIFSKTRKILQVTVWLIILCAIFTLINGLMIWFRTLKTTGNLEALWMRTTPEYLTLLQQRFQCCGFKEAIQFVPDSMCPNAADVARQVQCYKPFSAYANEFLNITFTAVFGVCAIDGILILSALCILRERAEQARYKRIDEKNGYRG